jgi:hypothetical protein
MRALRVRPVQHGRARALREGRREEHAHRPALRVAEERSRLASGSVHDRADVVHPRLEVGEADVAVGEPGAALVEADEPREGREPVEDARVGGMLAVDLEVREEARDEDEVERPVTRDGVRDVDVAASGVADGLAHSARPE